MRTILTIKASQGEADASVKRLNAANPRFKFDTRPGKDGQVEVAVVDAGTDQSTLDGLREIARESVRPMSKAAEAFRQSRSGGNQVSTPGNAVADAPVAGHSDQ